MMRTRLFLYVVPFAVLLLAVGCYAIALFSRLAHDVDVTVMENYRAATVAQTLGAALTRMEDGLRFALGDDRISAKSALDENSRIVEANLNFLYQHRHLFAGNRLVEQLQTNYRTFHAAGVAIIGSSQKSDLRRRYFDENIRTPKLAMDLLLEQARKSAHQHILATTQNIREINTRVTRLMIFAVVAAVFICAFASYQLGKSILRPIQLLTRAAREIGDGQLEQRVPVVSRDELGELAETFNKMAQQLQIYRRSTSEQIVRLHRAMEAALASFPDPIFVLDREGRIELKNPAARKLAGQFGFEDSLPARLAETAGEVARAGQDFLPHSFKEVLWFGMDGEERCFLPRILIMRGEADAPVGVAVVLQDVTRFRLLDDAKTNLVATVSHELKTPLTSVRMVLHLLLEEAVGPLTPKQTELLDTARKESERLLRILNDLLDLTQLEAGKSGLKLERVTPAMLMQSIADEAQQRVVDRGLTLACSVEPQLPSVTVDRQRMGHVFHNFIDNAIKHSPAAGEIQLRASRTEDGGIQFSVLDQGPGVPEEHQGRIFERFFRVPGQAKTGAGLGLSIAREITLAHGGHIGVRNVPGGGSEFYVVLATTGEVFGASELEQASLLT